MKSCSAHPVTIEVPPWRRNVWSRNFSPFRSELKTAVKNNKKKSEQKKPSNAMDNIPTELLKASNKNQSVFSTRSLRVWIHKVNH